jgi:phosphoglycolate phosphatase
LVTDRHHFSGACSAITATLVPPVPEASAYAAGRLALRCVYTDLDGTLLGRGGSLLRDPHGAFSLRQVRALEACYRAEVEVVIMSGRREPQVMSDARLIGQTSYIYEAGCAVMIDGERTLLTGQWIPDDGGTPAEKMLDAGIPQLLFERFPGRLEWHRPWHQERKLSHLFRGKVDVGAANAVLTEHGHEDLRFLDNGVIGRPMEGIDDVHAYHLVPGGASKAKGVEFHMRARGFTPAECIAIGDSVEDLDAARAVGRFFVVANGPERDPEMREAIAAYANVTTTEGRMGDGFYEAVVSTLAAR